MDIAMLGLDMAAIGAVVMATELVKKIIKPPERWIVLIPLIVGAVVAIPVTLGTDPASPWYTVALQAFVYAAAAAFLWKFGRTAIFNRG